MHKVEKANGNHAPLTPCPSHTWTEFSAAYSPVYRLTLLSFQGWSEIRCQHTGGCFIPVPRLWMSVCNAFYFHPAIKHNHIGARLGLGTAVAFGNCSHPSRTGVKTHDQEEGWQLTARTLRPVPRVTSPLSLDVFTHPHPLMTCLHCLNIA